MSKNHSRTAGQHSFSKIEGPTLERSTFNRNCGLKTTFDAGLLIPIFCEEALPGDTMKLKMHNFGRLATPLHPILDNMHIETFFFSVPYRLVWDNWQKFQGEQVDPGDSTDFLIPQTEVDQEETGTIFDYFGMPTDVSLAYDVSALPFRAYMLIWNEWFRSQDLQPSEPLSRGDGPDAANTFHLLRRGKRHDYFTSCLPFPQKGDSVSLPLGISAPVVGAFNLVPEWTVGATSTQTAELHGNDGTNVVDFQTLSDDSGRLRWKNTKLETDLSAATAATVNQLRQAFQVQRLLERDARGGTRYVEMIKAHFGVTSPDFRLQRPEYLGGGTQAVNVTPVPQTVGGGGTPQGALAGYGTTTGGNHSFVKSFDEHCIVIGLACLRGDLNYQQGVPRQFSRLTRYDHYMPALSHLGEQAVLNKEIFVQGTAADDDVFGYQERWAEYRYKPSMITGQMRSSFAQTLDTWHLAQDFDSLPLLNDEFIEEDPPIDRVIAVTSEPHMLFDAFFEFTHARPIPTFSTPGMIDHF